jgi:hypothetical protein
VICGCGKLIYNSKKKAQKARSFAPGGHKLSAYRCKQTGTWHLGNKPVWNGRFRKAARV